MKSFKEFLLEKQQVEDIRFQEEGTGYFSGQSNMILRAKNKEGQIMGYIEYSDYEGVPHVQFVKTLPSYLRMGVATKLLKELQRRYPDIEIDLGYSTEDGTELLKSPEMEREFYPNDEFETKMEEYKKMKVRYDYINDKFQKWYDLFDIDRDEAERQRAEIESMGDEFQDLEHKIYDIKVELQELPQGKYLFKI